MAVAILAAELRLAPEPVQQPAVDFLVAVAIDIDAQLSFGLASAGAPRRRGWSPLRIGIRGIGGDLDVA